MAKNSIIFFKRKRMPKCEKASPTLKSTKIRVPLPNGFLNYNDINVVVSFKPKKQVFVVMLNWDTGPSEILSSSSPQQPQQQQPSLPLPVFGGSQQQPSIAVPVFGGSQQRQSGIQPPSFGSFSGRGALNGFSPTQPKQTCFGSLAQQDEFKKPASTNRPPNRVNVRTTNMFQRSTEEVSQSINLGFKDGTQKSNYKIKKLMAKF